MYGCCQGPPRPRRPDPTIESWRELVRAAQIQLRDIPELMFDDAEVIVIRTAQINEFPMIYQFLTKVISANKVPEKDRRLIDELGLFLGKYKLIWSESRNVIFRQLQKANLIPMDKDLILFPSTGDEARLLLK
jgi:hypothetical protein